MINAAQAELHETTSPLLNALYGEMQELAKKKPEATISESKVKLINRLLEDIRVVLAKEPDLKYLDLLVNESLPQYSDVVLVLSQYTAAMKRFRSNNYVLDKDSGKKGWRVGGR